MRVICAICHKLVCELPPLDNPAEAGTVCMDCVYTTGEGYEEAMEEKP
jgi:hypothetical protein